MNELNTLKNTMLGSSALPMYMDAVEMLDHKTPHGTLRSLMDAVAALELAQYGGNKKLLQLALMQTAYETMRLRGTLNWGWMLDTMDQMHDVGRKVADLPLNKNTLALFGAGGEVPAKSRVEHAAMELAYQCGCNGKKQDVALWTASMARHGYIMAGIIRQKWNLQ